MMKVQEPPKLATWSAMRSPKVSRSSMSSLGLRLARPEMTRCAEWISRPSTVSMSRPASGLASSSTEMSWRSTSMQVVGSVATAVVWCGVPSSMEAKPKRSPWRGAEKSTSWPSSSMSVTSTAPVSMT